MAVGPERDPYYVALLLDALKECENYRPAFGSEGVDGVSLESFRQLYASDPLYHWVGLDSPMMYAAHKAAGGMTSVYRQLGIGCERLVREVVKDNLNLTADRVAWSYKYEKENGAPGVHTLDARIDTEHLKDGRARTRLAAWLAAVAQSLRLPPRRAKALRGTVFEVRQGYKSADSKRQNADLRFGMRAYNENYLPVVALVSTQVSAPVCRRYRSAQLLVLLGSLEDDERVSTFAFLRKVVGYDLAAFFGRNSERLRSEFTKVLAVLLSPTN